MRLAVALLLAFLISQHATCQSAPREFTDPLALLQAVAQTYADAGSTLRVESVTETRVNGLFQHDWRKVYLSAVKGPGKLYRIETRSPDGSYIQASDGTNEWVYLAEANLFVKRLAPEDGPGFSKVMIAGSSELTSAWRMPSSLEWTAGSYQRASMVGQQTIKVQGRKYPCYVVHVTEADLTRKQDNYRSDDTFWIDKTTLVFRKHVAHTDTQLFFTQTIHVPLHEDITTTYPVIDLHARTSPSEFAFLPPTNAKQVSSLEPELSNIATLRAKPEAQMRGKVLPDGALPAAALKAYRGRPLLIDLWATWCGPCLQAMPSLNRIYKDFASKGLQFVTVDEDTSAALADAYLMRHHYPWTNFHDADGSAQKALEDKGIPLTVLADANGTIVYYDFGGDEAGLRKGLAALGLSPVGKISGESTGGLP